jgi:hypothetical protein
MSIRVYVPRDSTALALGADALSSAINQHARERGIDIEIVRNGTRGLLWLEPLVEVETPVQQQSEWQLEYARFNEAQLGMKAAAQLVPAT